MDDSAATTRERLGDNALEYRAVEPWSILALLLGLASPLALIDPLLSLVPSCWVKDRARELRPGEPVLVCPGFIVLMGFIGGIVDE